MVLFFMVNIVQQSSYLKDKMINMSLNKSKIFMVSIYFKCKIKLC